MTQDVQMNIFEMLLVNILLILWFEFFSWFKFISFSCPCTLE